MERNICTIRTMTRQEVNLAIDWAAEEGWNPGLHDAECFYAADPGGFLVGLLGDEPISTLSAVRFGDSFGFVGFYIVKPQYRGMGYGIRLWQAGLARLEGRTIGLDGVVAQQENYQRSGFTLAYHNIRYQGIGGGSAPANQRIVPLSKIPWHEIASYDASFFPDNRSALLKYWIDQPQSRALGFLLNDKLAGYGVIRKCRSGYKIGPLFADEQNLAEHLFRALKAEAPEDSPVFLDIPEINLAAVDLVKRHKMIATFDTARMYKGIIPNLPARRIFGVMSFELG
jgi:GNAT superfamily N-acetyltransferase